MRLTYLPLSPSRRAALGLSFGGAAAIAFSRSAIAQTPPPPTEPSLLPELDENVRLVQNLLTRTGVQVGVGGRRKPVFVIDTGAERTAISDRLAGELKLRPHLPVLVHGVTAAEMVPTAELPRLEVSRRRFDNLRPPIFPYEVLAADGLLGLDVLSRFRLTLDFGRRNISLTPSDLRSLAHNFVAGQNNQVPDHAIQTRTGRSGQLILTNIQVEGIETVAFIDSGAQYSIGNRALMRAVDRRSPALRNQIRVYGVIGQSLMLDVGAVSSLRLARREMGSTPLLFGDLHAFQVLDLRDTPALVLGADILSRFSRVILDYGQSRIALEGSLRPAPPPAVRSP